MAIPGTRVAAASLVALAACGGDDGAPLSGHGAIAGDGGEAGSVAGDDAGRPSAPPSTVDITGDYVPFFNQRFGVVEGGEICAIGPWSPPLCALSDADGRYRITGVPSFSTFELRFAADGFVTSVRPIRSASHDIALFGQAYASDDLFGYFEEWAGRRLDPTKGVVVLEAVRGTAVWLRDVEGASAFLRSLATGGDIYPAAYVNEQQLPESMLTATTSSGWGLFVDVQPGEYLLVATHPTRSCRAHPVVAWPPPEGTNAALRVPVRASQIVYATAYCPG